MRRPAAPALALLATLCVGILPVAVGHGAGGTAAMTLPSPTAGSRRPPIAPAAAVASTDSGTRERHDGRRPATSAGAASAEHSAAIDTLEPELVLLGSWTV